MKTFTAFNEMVSVPSPKFQLAVDGRGLLVLIRVAGVCAHNFSGTEKSAFVAPIIIRFFLRIEFVQPVLLVTLKVTVKLPETEYVCEGFGKEELIPTQKSNK